MYDKVINDIDNTELSISEILKIRGLLDKKEKYIFDRDKKIIYEIYSDSCSNCFKNINDASKYLIDQLNNYLEDCWTDSSLVLKTRYIDNETYLNNKEQWIEV